MIYLNRGSHTINGETVEVLEVWRREQEDGGAELILSVPLEKDEKVTALL